MQPAAWNPIGRLHVQLLSHHSGTMVISRWQSHVQPQGTTRVLSHPV
jgi:hypothetical protein